jgi:hypothetical protein
MKGARKSLLYVFTGAFVVHAMQTSKATFSEQSHFWKSARVFEIILEGR